MLNGSSAMYRPGKILYSGGASSVITTQSATATTAVLDTTGRDPDLAADPADAVRRASTTR